MITTRGCSPHIPQNMFYSYVRVWFLLVLHEINPSLHSAWQLLMQQLLAQFVDSLVATSFSFYVKQVHKCSDLRQDMPTDSLCWLIRWCLRVLIWLHASLDPNILGYHCDVTWTLSASWLRCLPYSIFKNYTSMSHIVTKSIESTFALYSIRASFGGTNAHLIDDRQPQAVVASLMSQNDNLILRLWSSSDAFTNRHRRYCSSRGMY